jgi:protein-tyrosine phosphatase
MIRSILVLCEGNVCRSPMAGALLARHLPEARVISAGTRALVGHSAYPLAIDTMAARGIDIASHVAIDVNLELVRSADLVLTMSTAQQHTVEAGYPFARGRVYRLCQARDVIDPYRKGHAIFEASLQQIEQGVARWLELLAKPAF